MDKLIKAYKAACDEVFETITNPNNVAMIVVSFLLLFGFGLITLIVMDGMGVLPTLTERNTLCQP